MTGGLLTTTETEDQVEGRLLLDIVVGKGVAILQQGRSQKVIFSIVRGGQPYKFI